MRKQKSSMAEMICMHLKNIERQAKFSFEVIGDLEGQDTLEMLHVKTEFWSSFGFIQGTIEGLLHLLPEVEQERLRKK